MAATAVSGKERVIAAAQQIVKNLESTKSVSEDMIMILSSFDNRLSSMTELLSSDPARLERRIEELEKAVFRCDLKFDSEGSGRHSIAWEESPEDAAEFFSVVDEILDISEGSVKDSDVLDRAESMLQMAMARLEDEFRQILVRNTVPLETDRLYGSFRRVSLSFASHDGEIGDFEGEEEERDSPDVRGSLTDNLCADLVHPDAVSCLRNIVSRMVRAGYEKECFQVYNAVRREVFDEYLSIVGVDKLSIEEILKMEWKDLNEKMKKWIQALQILIRVLLPGEKRLCDQVFGASELTKDVCFTETAKGCIMQLLNFGNAIVICKRSSEKLFRILDMYDTLSNLLPNIGDLFSGAVGDLIFNEANGMLKGLGDAAKATLAEFEMAIQNETSKANPGGEVHPVARYVMNYAKFLVDYSDSLTILLTERVEDNIENSLVENDTETPLGYRVRMLISSLERKLEEKSKSYEDIAMQYVFLMNNVFYIVHKVKDSELATILGEQWIRQHGGQIRQYATSYLRAAWSSVVSLLRDEVLHTSGSFSSSGVSKAALKERFKAFNSAFEDIYRSQTAWKIIDPQLREELRISISEKVLPAYGSFVSRYRSHLESGRRSDKYIKYSPEDLQNYLPDFFEGVPGNLTNPRRRL